MAKALAKVPMERYATCPQFADALRRACGLEPGSRGPARAGAGPEPTQLSGWPPGQPGAAGSGAAIASGYGRVRGSAGRGAAAARAA